LKKSDPQVFLTTEATGPGFLSRLATALILRALFLVFAVGRLVTHGVHPRLT